MIGVIFDGYPMITAPSIMGVGPWLVID